VESSIEQRADSPNWYVVHCQPSKEVTAARALAGRLGLRSYVPQIRQVTRGQLRSGPLFPGYAFVQATLSARTLRAINSLQGVIRLVAFDGAPQAVPPEAVDHIRQHLDGLFAAGARPERTFEQGDPVRITHGPLQGLEAEFVGALNARQRAKVLIDFLGQQRQAEVPVAALEPVQVFPGPRSERRSRGHGRSIRPRPGRLTLIGAGL
jgi:transcriptional antiterminator RfaH